MDIRLRYSAATAELRLGLGLSLPSLQAITLGLSLPSLRAITLGLSLTCKPIIYMYHGCFTLFARCFVVRASVILWE
jgi:hypothetical protein